MTVVSAEPIEGLTLRLPPGTAVKAPEQLGELLDGNHLLIRQIPAGTTEIRLD